MVARVLLIGADKAIRTQWASALQGIHQWLDGKDLITGVKHMAKLKPEVILVSQEPTRREALKLLTYMRDQTLKTPVVVVITGGKSSDVEPALRKLGAKVILEVPTSREKIVRAVNEALTAHKAEQAGPPPITEEEEQNNLSMLERGMNGKMKCFAGRNQVFIQSRILGGGVTRPRIALRCPLRAEYGMSREVFYEHIRDVCCREPSTCEAFRHFKEENEAYAV